ncbi:hypothetical protein [Sphingomonas sp. PvP018]|uniref:hypothetical protein n=1 Tax=Sphingomonas sp. PvP018 TaxID=2817852 RepID=UPI001AE86DF0|nr:hypothetical protein [Sphingomonas sp. PvP018]MBP2513783.1 hypothetical protein [Sphingomonas sp. PvP018]
MHEAAVDGLILSIGAYGRISNAGRNGLHRPRCPECRVEVIPHGLSSPSATPCFRHPPASEDLDPLEDCSLARRSNRLRWFGDAVMDRDRGKRIRAAFFEDGCLAASYAFCLVCAGRGGLPVDKFRRMIARADRMDVWSYAGVETWCIPHVLLLLADFKEGTAGAFHFSLRRVGSLQAIWSDPNLPVSLEKLFSDSLRPMTHIGGHENPRPILPRDVAETKSDWVTPSLLANLRSD